MGPEAGKPGWPDHLLKLRPARGALLERDARLAHEPAPQREVVALMLLMFASSLWQ